MTKVSHKKSEIIRTERGLTISNTRITLYDVMDYLKEKYPPKFICGLFDLTEEQINTALDYIAENSEQVEAEYQLVLKEAAELREYYESKNRELIDRIAGQPPKPGTEHIWKKLQAAKAKRQSKK